MAFWESTGWFLMGAIRGVGYGIIISSILLLILYGALLIAFEPTVGRGGLFGLLTWIVIWAGMSSLIGISLAIGLGIKNKNAKHTVF